MSKHSEALEAILKIDEYCESNPYCSDCLFCKQKGSKIRCPIGNGLGKVEKADLENRLAELETRVRA